MFQQLYETEVLQSGYAAGNFGKALVLLGIVMLAIVSMVFGVGPFH